MELKELLIIIVSVLICILVFYLVCQTKIREKIYALLLDAEKNEEDGVKKMDYVVMNAYEYLPSCFKVFISMPTFRTICQKLYDKMRDIAFDGKLNGEG